jgi:hypothetical protein
MKKVSISFDKFGDVNFQQKSQFIYGSLNGNPWYVNLVPALPEVKMAIDKYATDLAAAATRERNAVALKNQSRTVLEGLLKQLGLSVMTEANGDEAALVSSGFTLNKDREPSYITNPGNVTLSNGITSGQMISSIKVVAGGKSYVHEIASELPVDESMWVSHTSSASKFVFNNLVPGKQYWVRVAVIGSREQKAYSTVGTMFAQ